MQKGLIEIKKIPIILLAGGLGLRLSSLFPDMPKVMVDVNGKPFLEWILLYLENSGFKDFIISAGYLGEKIEGYFKNRDVDFRIRFKKEDRPLGTGGAIIFVSKQINYKDFLVMNADSLAMLDFNKFVKFYYKEKPDVLIAVKRVNSGNRYGVIKVDRSNRVIAFNEKVKTDCSGKKVFINTGIYLLKNEMLRKFCKRNNFPISFEKDIIPTLIKDNESKIMVFKTKGDFLDIGTPESYKMGKNFIERNMSKFGRKI